MMAIFILHSVIAHDLLAVDGSTGGTLVNLAILSRYDRVQSKIDSAGGGRGRNGKFFGNQSVTVDVVEV